MQLRHLNRNGFQLRKLLGVLKTKEVKQPKPRVKVDTLTRDIHMSREYRNLSGAKANQMAGLSKCHTCSIKQYCSEMRHTNYLVTPRTCKRAKAYIEKEILMRALIKDSVGKLRR